jgi:hypothetical protein
MAPGTMRTPCATRAGCPAVHDRCATTTKERERESGQINIGTRADLINGNTPHGVQCIHCLMYNNNAMCNFINVYASTR